MGSLWYPGAICRLHILLRTRSGTCHFWTMHMTDLTAASCDNIIKNFSTINMGSPWMRLLILEVHKTTEVSIEASKNKQRQAYRKIMLPISLYPISARI